MLARLVELAPAGFEQVDGDGFVEFALYGAPGELPELPRGRAQLGDVQIEVSATEIGDDWADRWREFHKPVPVGRIRVRAPWHEASPAHDPAGEAVIDIVIDPGQAFGTGAHPTTRLCLELLLDVTADAGRGRGGFADRGRGGLAGRGRAGPARRGRGGLADLGCGSGVLAIAAAKLGFAPVVAVDNEEAAVDATLANARANGVTIERVERYDLRAGPAPVERVTVANLVRPLLLRVAESWRERATAERPEALIVSGLLEGEEDEVAAAFAPLRERRRLRLQEWSALLLTRP